MMSDWIDNAVAEVEKKQNELRQMMQAVNLFCAGMGLAPRYTDAALMPTGSAIRSGQFYGKPLATAVREFLDTRPKGHAATPDEILVALERGGFNFDALAWKEEFRLRSLTMSLAKNVVTFHRLPNGDFGLTAWYPDIVRKKKDKEESEIVVPDATVSTTPTTPASSVVAAVPAPTGTAATDRKKPGRKPKPPAPAGTDGAAS